MFVKKWFNLSLVLSIALLAVAAFTTLKVLPAQAAGTIVVNSTADDEDNDGDCTLREAIIAANTDTASGLAVGECAAGSGADTIEFNIGPLDGGVKTIAPTSQLPDITSQVTIDGYTQDTAAPNAAISPAPLNGTLLIEINGANAGSPGIHGLTIGANNTIIQGLSINRFSYDGIVVAADNIKIWGNYLGTDPTGLIDRGNGGSGIAQSGGDNDNLEFGGLTPSKRNISSGNDNTGLSPNDGSDNWVIQGNYFGLAANGTSAIPNATVGGSGALSIDHSNGVLIGGSSEGAANVISGNYSHGIAPLDSSNLVVEGNLIGTDYTGTVALGNGGGGVIPTRSNGAQIINNIIANSGADGVYIGESEDALITGNTIGSGSVGDEVFGNGQSGIFIDGSQRVTIGGVGPTESNTVVNSTLQGVSVVGASQDVTVIGNVIKNNDALGIDLGQDGVTTNDPSDLDSGPNDLLNFPSYTSMAESAGNTTIEYRLDAPAGDYRIEFFFNWTADGSGNGEGEAYLGSADITHTGSGIEEFSHTLVGVVGIANLALTATERNMPTPSTYGATSEFGGQTVLVTDVSLAKNILNPDEVAAGGSIEYQLTLTNNDLDDIDLTQFNNPLGTAIISDFLDPDLTPTNLDLDAPGPLPGSYYLGDVGNPNLTCLWAGPGSGAIVGLTTYGDYSFVTCTFTGVGDTTLEAGGSLSMILTATIAGNSDMVFTNYALATASLIGDPDNASIANIFGSGEDYLGLLIANQASNDPINNFASAVYPVPVSPGLGITASPASPLAAAGTNEYSWLLAALALITSSAWFASQALRHRARRRS